MSIDSGFVILAFGVLCICWAMTILVKNVQHAIVMKWMWYQYVKQKDIGSREWRRYFHGVLEDAKVTSV